jgi:hypothetical protein
MTASVIYLKNALCPQKRRTEHVKPCTIRSKAPEWDLPYVAFINGEVILRAEWDRMVHHGDVVAFIDVNAIPQGGGGGGSDPLRMVLMIAVMVMAPYAGAYMGVMTGVGTAAGWSMAVGMAGMMLVNALIPPPKPTSPQQAAALAAPSPTYNIQAQGNSARLEAAITEHFGRHIVFPDYAANPYVEYYGQEQYLYSLLCIGRGWYDIEQIRIEDTPIANFEEITYEIVNPHEALDLFPANVVSSIEVSGQDMPTGTYLGSFVANASGTQANYLGVDFVMPRGMYYANDDGSLATVSISATVEARLIDDVGAPLGLWVTLGSPTYSAATTTPLRYSERYSVTAGRYEVRVKRTDTEQTTSRYGHDLIWSGLRAYLPETRDFGDVTLLALRMRASNNLSMQASRKVNCIATRKIPIWRNSAYSVTTNVCTVFETGHLKQVGDVITVTPSTGTMPSGSRTVATVAANSYTFAVTTANTSGNCAVWSANTATRSIAWPIAYACKQVGLTDAQIDLATLLALDAVWVSRSDYFDARFDNFLGFWEAVTKMAGAGRAKPYMQGGIMRIMRDQAATVPVALFSMRNIVKGSFSVDYLMPTADTADAIDVGYFDSGTWSPRRVRAKLPGSTAARPAKVELFGVTGRDQAFREGMYQAASNRYRRKVIHFTTEMEGFIPSFGDLIAIQHDMPAWGQGGEITAWDAGTLTATLSDPLTWSPGSTHYIALRKRDGSVEGPYVVTAGLYDNQAILQSIPTFTPYTAGAEERTHYTFGWAETWRQPARLLSARPRGMHQIEIEAVNEDNSVHTAENGQTAPAQSNSQLSSYTTAPLVEGLTAYSMNNSPDKMLLQWKPSPWADYYLVEQSSDGVKWTRSGEPSSSNYTATALYGSHTIVRVAAVGLARGPWVQVAYGVNADYMWAANDTTLMWNATDTTLMWRY